MMDETKECRFCGGTDFGWSDMHLDRNKPFRVRGCNTCSHCEFFFGMEKRDNPRDVVKLMHGTFHS